LPKFTFYQTTPVLYHILNKSQAKNAVFLKKCGFFTMKERSKQKEG